MELGELFGFFSFPSSSASLVSSHWDELQHSQGFCFLYHSFIFLITLNSFFFLIYKLFPSHLLVLPQVSVVTVRTGDDLLRTVLVKMFLQKSLLKFGAAIILAKDFSILAVCVYVVLKQKCSNHDQKLQ